MNQTDIVPEDNDYLSKKNQHFEEKNKKGKLTTEELNRLLLNIDPAEFEKPNFGEDDFDSETEDYQPVVEPEVIESDMKPGYHQKLNQFECIEEVTESFEETSEELLKNSSKAHPSSRASRSSAGGLSGFKDVQVLQSSDRLHSESGSLHDRIAITKDQISALEDLEKQLEEDIITISSSKEMI